MLSLYIQTYRFLHYLTPYIKYYKAKMNLFQPRRVIIKSNSRRQPGVAAALKVSEISQKGFCTGVSCREPG